MGRVSLVVRPELVVYSRHLFDRYMLRKTPWGTTFGAKASARILEPLDLERAVIRGVVRYIEGNLLRLVARIAVNDSTVWEETMYVRRVDTTYPEAYFEVDVSGLIVHGFNEFKIMVIGTYGGWANTIWDVWLDLVYTEEPEEPPEITPPPEPWWEGVIDIIKWGTVSIVAIMLARELIAAIKTERG